MEILIPLLGFSTEALPI